MLSTSKFMLCLTSWFYPFSRRLVTVMSCCLSPAYGALQISIYIFNYLNVFVIYLQNSIMIYDKLVMFFCSAVLKLQRKHHLECTIPCEFIFQNQ